MTASQPAGGRRWWTFAAGVIFGVGALVAAPLAGLKIGGFDPEQRGQVTWLSLFAGTFLTGCLFWWLIVGRSGRLSRWRGAVTGVVVAIVSYPVVLTLAELFRRDGNGGSVGDRFLNVLELALLTIVTSGFAATLVMAAVGSLAAFALWPAYPETPAREWSAAARGLAKAGAIIAVVVVSLLAAAFIWLSAIPLDAKGLAQSRPASDPAVSHEQAIVAFEAVRAEEAELPLNPRCLSKLLTHGAKVGKVVIFLHGLTNCPAQADELAPELFDLGYNVYVPRLPGHGEADPMTLALVDLTAEGVVQTVDRSIDLAQGLGDEVFLVGLSGGGTLTMWAAQYRSDVAHTIALAPFLGPNGVPHWANRAATNLLLMLPNIMMVWNPLEPNGPPGMEYAYPRVATHALAQFMRLGEIVDASARDAPPLAAGLGLVVNDADFAVNNDLALRVAASWRRHGREVDLEVLPLSKRLIHDLIDPRQPEANTEFVYALLIDMISRQTQGGAEQ